MLLISGLCFANWREASPVHVNRCLQRSGYLNAAQAIQAMREQYKIFFFFPIHFLQFIWIMFHGTKSGSLDSSKQPTGERKNKQKDSFKYLSMRGFARIATA